MNTPKITNQLSKQRRKSQIYENLFQYCRTGYSRRTNVIFQVFPAFTFSASLQPITLECDPGTVGTDVVVTGWGSLSVRRCVNYCLP